MHMKIKRLVHRVLEKSKLHDDHGSFKESFINRRSNNILSSSQDR